MGARSTGLSPRRGYLIDAEAVLVGYVAAGTRGRAAETRDGDARLLTTRLEAQDVVKVVAYGGPDAAGQYTIQAAHVAEGGVLADASDYATLAVITCAPGIQELALSGPQIRALVAAAADPAIEGDPRVVAVQAVPGEDDDAPEGAITISIQPGD